MEVLGIIAFIVLGYIVYKDYKQDRQDKLRRQKEAQEAATRLNFEQELKKKATQWISNPFFLKLANYATIKIADHISSATSRKIGRGEKDIYNIFCKNSYIEIRENGSYTRSTTYHYREMGFDNLPYDSTTIASLNLALFQYLQKRFQTLPKVSFSLNGGDLSNCIITDSDGHLSWHESNFELRCDMTKVHPLLEEITLP